MSRGEPARSPGSRKRPGPAKNLRDFGDGQRLSERFVDPFLAKRFCGADEALADDISVGGEEGIKRSAREEGDDSHGHESFAKGEAGMGRIGPRKHPPKYSIIYSYYNYNVF